MTTVMQTLGDLADSTTTHQLERAFAEAERRGLFDLRALPDLRGRRGRAKLEELLREHQGPPPVTRSELERHFLRLCRAARLPEPSTNLWIAGQEVDAVWPVHRLVVEVDSYIYHRTRGAFEEDRRRDAALQLAGYRVLRVTDRRISREPAGVARDIRILLGTAAPAPSEPRTRAPR